MTDLVQDIDDGSAISDEVQQLVDRARMFAEKGKSENTKRAYRSDFEHFSAWCDQHGFPTLPSMPEVVALYITSMADDDYAQSTIERRLVAISQAHKFSGLSSPTTHQQVREVWRGIRRELDSTQTGKRPLSTVELRRILADLDPEKLIDVRDAALLLVGFAGALRRSELVSLRVGDVEERQEGAVLHLRRSKTDQEGEGQKVALPFGQHEETCPVGALRRWQAVGDVEEGYLFRALTRSRTIAERALSAKSVSLIVKKRVEQIGLKPERYGAHSLRSGMATEAARHGATERQIMRQTRHRSLKVLRGYIDDGGIFRQNAAKLLGL